jgi:hypothetical protein
MPPQNQRFKRHVGVFSYTDSVIHSTTQSKPTTTLRLLAELSNVLVEGPTLYLGNLEFESGGLA